MVRESTYLTKVISSHPPLSFGLVFAFPTFDYSITPVGPRSRYLRSDGWLLFGDEADESIGCFSGEPRVLADEDTNSGFLTQQGSFPTQ